MGYYLQILCTQRFKGLTILQSIMIIIAVNEKSIYQYKNYNRMVQMSQHLPQKDRESFS